MLYSNRWLILMGFLLIVSLSHSSLSPNDKLDESLIPSLVPNPNHNPELCGRDSLSIKKSSICDPHNILSNDDKNIIEGCIKDVESAQVGVLIIKKIKPSFIGFSSVEASAQSFAKKVHDSWEIGDRTLNNGILIFISTVDRIVYISTGVGVEGKISSHVIESLIDNSSKHLKIGQYGLALQQIVTEIKLILSSPVVGHYSDYIAIFLFFLFVLTFIIISCQDRDKITSVNAAKADLEKLMKEMKDCKDKDLFLSPSCPICLENYPEVGAIDENRDGMAMPLDGDEKKEANAHSPKRPMSLQCGHVFCFQCLRTFLSTSASHGCPICRKPVSPDHIRPQPNRPQSRPFNSHQSYSHGDGTDCSNRMQDQTTAGSITGNAWATREAEFLFRLNRIHHRNPLFLSPAIYDSLTSSISDRNIDRFTMTANQRFREVQEILTSYEARKEAASRGSTGSTSSFGGGRSHGGGGRRF